MTVPTDQRDLLDVLRRPLDELPHELPLPTLRPGQRPTVSVRPPGSKSLTNRAIILAALAHGDSVLHHPLTEAEDARVMADALRSLGATIVESPGRLDITGVGGRWKTGSEPIALHLANAGTAVRFLAAAALLSAVPITLDGSERMRQRPIGDLAEALTALGARVEWLGTPGCPPLRITPGKPQVAATIGLSAAKSSQFVSALLLAAPFLPGGLTVRIKGQVASAPYIDMTMGLLAHVGAVAKNSLSLDLLRVCAQNDVLPGFEYQVEPDASGATYFWAAGAMIPGGTVTVEGLSSASLQGDTGFAALLARAGAATTASDVERKTSVTGPETLNPLLADMSGMPDAAMTLAAAACFARGTTILRGLHTLRDKESDRVHATATELRKIGVHVENPVSGDRDAMTITPPSEGVDADRTPPPVIFDTYNDHRMAMSLSLIALRRPNVIIRDPRCVAKTYPGYWRDFATLFATP